MNLEFQHPIFIRWKGEITKFFIADFCDVERKIIIEIDGKYHDDSWQQMLDEERTAVLKRRGYKVYRISNEAILGGKSTYFLYKVYKKYGVTISNIS